MSKQQDDLEGRERIHRRAERDARREHRTPEDDADKLRRSRHTPYQRPRHRYFDEWDAD